MLLGILLGYGEESSKAFVDVLANYTTILDPPPTEYYQRIEMASPVRCKINPVVFMGNPQALQVKEVIALYEKELKGISKIYTGSIKIVLEKVCEK